MLVFSLNQYFREESQRLVLHLKKVKHFKYFGARVNKNANSHEAIRKGMIIANRCYFGLITPFKLNMLFTKIKK